MTSGRQKYQAQYLEGTREISNISNICGGNIKIWNTELLVAKKNIKISSTAIKSGRKSIKKSNICGGNIKHRIISGGKNIKNIKRTIYEWRDITISSKLLVAGKISNVLVAAVGGVVLFPSLNVRKCPKVQLFEIWKKWEQLFMMWDKKESFRNPQMEVSYSRLVISTWGSRDLALLTNDLLGN